MTPHVSCLTSHVSCPLSHVSSCLMSLVSSALFCVQHTTFVLNTSKPKDFAKYLVRNSDNTRFVSNRHAKMCIIHDHACAHPTRIHTPSCTHNRNKCDYIVPRACGTTFHSHLVLTQRANALSIEVRSPSRVGVKLSSALVASGGSQAHRCATVGAWGTQSRIPIPRPCIDARGDQ